LLLALTTNHNASAQTVLTGSHFRKNLKIDFSLNGGFRSAKEAHAFVKANNVAVRIPLIDWAMQMNQTGTASAFARQGNSVAAEPLVGSTSHIRPEPADS
jgi:hypothetical protein